MRNLAVGTLCLTLLTILASAEQPRQVPAPTKKPSPAKPRAPALQLGARTVDLSGSALSPAGGYDDALNKPDAFPADQQVSVKASIAIKEGSPVGDLALYVLPVDETGPGLILGFSGGSVGIGNPKVVTDAKGRLVFTAGPLWKFTKRITLGLLVPRSPDRPFDLSFLPIISKGEPLTLELSQERRSFDLGVITLVIAQPKPVPR